MDQFQFRRPDEAKRFADALTGQSPFSHRSGLFLAGPRRTGKSTFLRQDLVPELEARDVLTLYVDLWADRGADPADLIAEKLRQTIADLATPVQKVAKAVGLQRVLLAGVEITLPQAGLPEGLSLPDALGRIGEAAGKPIALIVDEAQHALSSDRGVDAMFALKAARDAMNQGVEAGTPPLILVFTGSHRDKLVGLLRNNRQPFYGASVTDMPLLGPDYVEAYSTWLNGWLAKDNQIDAGEAFKAFEILGHRPELLEATLKDIALGPGGANSLSHRLLAEAEAIRARLWSDYDNDFGALSKTERVVLEEMIAQGTTFQPFIAETLTAIAARLGKNRISKSSIQSALNELKDKGLVWQSGRGQYALEDQGMIPWLKARGVNAANP